MLFFEAIKVTLQLIRLLASSESVHPLASSANQLVQLNIKATLTQHVIFNLSLRVNIWKVNVSIMQEVLQILLVS